MTPLSTPPPPPPPPHRTCANMRVFAASHRHAPPRPPLPDPFFSFNHPAHPLRFPPPSCCLPRRVNTAHLRHSPFSHPSSRSLPHCPANHAPSLTSVHTYSTSPPPAPTPLFPSPPPYVPHVLCRPPLPCPRPARPARRARPPRPPPHSTSPASSRPPGTRPPLQH